MDLTELYQDLILDHGKKPRNFGKCNKFNHDAEGHNPLCGDNIHVYLSLDADKKVKDISTEMIEGEIERIANNYVMYSSWYK